MRQKIEYMNSTISNNLEQVLSKDLTRETLYKLFIESNVQSINVDKINIIDTEDQPLDVRHRVEKLLFLNLLMDYDLENQIEQRKNTKYDYMIGLLLYISSDPHFKYGFGYFKDCIQSFDKLLVQWCKFLNSVIADINALPVISLKQQIVIEFSETLNITLSKGVVYKVEIDMDNFDKLFNNKDKTYDFSIRIDKVIFDMGKSDGSGLQSNLYKTVSELNRLITTLSLKRELEPMLIPLTHEH